MTAFVVRRFVDRGLLIDLSANPDEALHHPGQVDQVCQREDLADLVTADTPPESDQAAARLGVRRVKFDHLVRLGWVPSPQSIEARFGTSWAGAVDVPLYTTASVDAVPAEHPEADWKQLRTVAKGRRSPLAALSRNRRPYRRKPPGSVHPPAPHSVRKGGPGRGRAHSSCVPLTRARQPAPTAVGHVRSRRSGNSGRPRGAAGTDDAGGVPEEPGESGNVRLVDREFLASAERELQGHAEPGEARMGQVPGHRAKRVVHLAHRLRTGQLHPGRKDGVGGRGEGQQPGRAGE
ncbi:hypothetical protein [Streptomyces cinereoruber]|uniref:hypothetical protein n=1 Tax=Streptomyces cinereoruber TaxID=67260 RepID=UPI003638881F